MGRNQSQVEILSASRSGHGRHGESGRSQISVDVKLSKKNSGKKDGSTDRKAQNRKGKRTVTKEAIVHVRIPLNLWKQRHDCSCRTCDATSAPQQSDDDSYDSTDSSDFNDYEYDEYKHHNGMRLSPRSGSISHANLKEHHQPNEASVKDSQRGLQNASRSRGSYSPRSPKKNKANYSQSQRDLLPTHHAQTPFQPQGGYTQRSFEFPDGYVQGGREQVQGNSVQLPRSISQAQNNDLQTHNSNAKSQGVTSSYSIYTVPRDDGTRGSSIPDFMSPRFAQPQANVEARNETNVRTTPRGGPAQRVPSFDLNMQDDHRQPGSQPSPSTSNDHSDLIHLKDQVMRPPNKRLAGKKGQGKAAPSQPRVLRKVFFLGMSPCDVADWLHHLPTGCLPDNTVYNRQLHDLEDVVLEKGIDGEGFDYLLQTEKLIDLGVKSVHSRSFVGKRIKIAWDTEFC